MSKANVIDELELSDVCVSADILLCGDLYGRGNDEWLENDFCVFLEGKCEYGVEARFPEIDVVGGKSVLVLIPRLQSCILPVLLSDNLLLFFGFKGTRIQDEKGCLRF